MRRLLTLLALFSPSAFAGNLPTLTRFQQDIRESNYFSGSPATFASFCIKDSCLSTVAGYTDFTRKQPVDAYSLSSVGSLSKYMTAVLTLKLIEEGYLHLDDTLAQFFPEYEHWQGVTVRDLLSHSSGIPDYLFTPEGTKRTLYSVFDWHQKIWRPREILDLVIKEPSVFPAGTKVEYNNTNYVLLGMILEKATRRSLDALLEREIFAPLGMHDTYLTLPESQKHRRVAGFFPMELPLPDWLFNLIAHKVEKAGSYIETTKIFDPSLTWSAGAVVSTAEDLTRFTKGLFSGKILSAASLEAMQEFRAGTVLGMPFEYGLGLMRQTTAYGTLLGHGGLTPGYQAISNYIKERDQVITVLQNMAPAQAYSVYYDLIEQIQSNFQDPAFISDPTVNPEALEARSVHLRLRGKVTGNNQPGSYFSPSFGFVRIEDKKPEEGLYQSFSSQWNEGEHKLVLRASSSPFPLFGLGNDTSKGIPLLELHLDRDSLVARGLGSFAGDEAQDSLQAYKGRMFPSASGRKICLEQVGDTTREAHFRIQTSLNGQLEVGETIKFAGNIPLRTAKLDDLSAELKAAGWEICPK